MDQFVAEGYAQKLCIRYVSGPRNHFVRPQTTDDGCCTTMAKGKILKTRAEHVAVMKSCWRNFGKFRLLGSYRQMIQRR